MFPLLSTSRILTLITALYGFKVPGAITSSLKMFNSAIESERVAQSHYLMEFLKVKIEQKVYQDKLTL